MFTLKFTHHALQRYVEPLLQYADFLPKHVSYVLDLDGAKKVNKLMKSILKIIPNTQRIALPPNKQWGKFMKHGADNSVMYCAKDWTTFVILREGVNHTVVTVARPPKDKRDAEVDDSIGNPSGAVYLKDVSKVVVPYFLKDGLEYPVAHEPMRHYKVPLYFGKVPDAEELPL